MSVYTVIQQFVEFRQRFLLAHTKQSFLRIFFHPFQIEQFKTDIVYDETMDA